MTGAAVTVTQTSTVGGAIEAVRRRGEVAGLHHVYVVDAGSRLSGVVSVRDLVLSRPDTPVSRVVRPVAAVAPGADPEDVARMLRRGRHAALPVVDVAGRLVGEITPADAMRSLDDAATGDAQQMFGAGSEERLTTPWVVSARRRLPWLLVNLLLAAVSASVVRLFEGTIGAWTLLAMYLPVVAGMGGNASAQAMAVAVRGIAVGDAGRAALGRVVARELRVGAASGLVIGAVAACVAAAVHGEQGLLLGGLVALSLLVIHTVACAWGAAVPLVMKSLGFDPAQSAAIFTTTVTDMVAFFTLLGLAALLLRVG